MNTSFSVVRPLDPQIFFFIRIARDLSTTLSILAGLVTIIVIVNGSNRTNGKYSRLQIIVVTLSILNDAFVQLIFCPHFLLPLPCLTRLDPLFPIGGGIVVHYMVWISIVAEQAPAYVACFLYRHQVILPPSSRWRLSENGRKLCLFSYSIIALSPAPLVWNAKLPHDQISVYAKYLSPEWPSDIIDRIECSTFEMIQPFSTTTLLLHTVTVTIVFTLVIHSSHQLNISLTISARRRAYQRAMMRILILQSLLPITVQVLPNVAGITIFVFGWSGSAVYPVILLILSTNSFVLSMVVLGTTPIYRIMIRKAIFGRLRRKQTQTISMHASTDFER